MSGEKQKLYADLLYVGAGLLAKLLILPLPLPLLWLLILICLPLSQRPNAGIAQGAPRQGCRGSRPRPWMADGGGPPEQCRSEGMPSLGEAPNGGVRALGYLGLFQVTRCKSETASSHHRRNGYVPPTLHQAARLAALISFLYWAFKLSICAPSSSSVALPNSFLA
ncbi:hypothetical protein EAH72_16570 [Pseudomonas caspiana]|nr:hypothetical protein EAH72_16570 [Pseudomonas caspiana]